ncbi:protein SMAX1-LIKE 4-like [Abrus precatorius]|uniref:Protein SMAX1-LIKE 4-like n=1 Tax=Abrus precatorius TaxID=3816 RepID=A0A8B8K6Q4_ABRPR|nr:protein SMAX1-LIKE 4-like [Abrus precatorius]
MRSGACTLQQTLTAEAASVLKHSLGLARRRGHAQVTPLHVAATLLSLRASSLRRACLKSQPHQTSHPLQCRALELCFNVALNRLPTTPGPLLHSQPSLSNALIAALKRAQAHQRRGCIEQQQQQPLLTIKVELEQLIISILDDPSVSRVMREAGFSSTAVKSNIEDTSSAPNVFQCYNSSGGVFSSPCSPSPSENQRESINASSVFRQNHFLAAYTSDFSPLVFSPQKKGTAVSVPSGGLDLSLHGSSVRDSKMTITQNPSHMLETKLFGNNKEEQDKLNCCEECASNYEKEAQLFKPGQKNLLPSWLQSNTTEAHQKDELTQLKRKWNRLCHCLHQSKQPQNNWSNNSSSISFADSPAKPAYSPNNVVPRFRRQQSCTIEFNFSDVTQKKPSSTETTTTTTTLDCLKGMEGNNKEVKITLALGNSTFGGSGQTVENITTDRTLRRAHICKLLQENVPWQSETVPSIAEALVGSNSAKQSAITWLFMQGNDSIGKARLARAIAESVFGSVDVILHLDMLRKKENSATPFSEMVVGALKTHENLVILIESFDFADAQFRKFLADGFGTAKFGNLCRTEENSGQAIFILTNGSTRSNEEQNMESVIKLVLQINETKPTFESSSPCLGHKRRAELDFFTKIKNPRIEEKEEDVLVSEEGNRKREFSRHSSFNNLDLNMIADEGDDGEDKTGGHSPISSDLTRENVADPLSSNGSLDSVENKFEFNENPEKEKEMGENFLNMIKESFEEVYGKQCVVNFTVEERVIEEIGVGCGSFTNSMFEKWLKDIFQSSLQTVNFGGKEGIGFTLCWGGKGDRKSDSGFMGTCLPKNIQVNYFMD